MTPRSTRCVQPVALALAGCVVGLVACNRDQRSRPTTGPWAQVPKAKAHTDHSSFFLQPMADGPSVTRRCLTCHPDASHQVMQTAHWNWEGDEVEVAGHEGKVRIGKKNQINNFCIGIASNWAACTSCHIGYGWEDANFDFSDKTKVDCLVCHDQSGTYEKKAKGAGLPGPGVDLQLAAQSVGRPSRQNCGVCHFNGGGGNAIKHGDLDQTLMFPSERIDVHMGKNNMVCVDCHITKEHNIPGRSMSVSVDDKNRLECSVCHGDAPHADERVNKHTGRVACQTCHVPHFAVEEPTKMSWDWSRAGQDLGIADTHVYMKIKGRFTYGKGIEPLYYWYNYTSGRYILGDTIDPTQVTKMAYPLGGRDDAKAKIWPFKVHRGKQIYDKINKNFFVPNVHGPEGYWTTFDWARAAQIGNQATGLPYSGQYDFAPTEMYWPLSHMVATKDKALQCRDCHGERGRLDWPALGYDKDPLSKDKLEHDAITLQDAQGKAVQKSGAPLDTRASCGECHSFDDDDFKAAHRYHARLDTTKLLPERALLMQDGPRLFSGGDRGAGNSNCFLCHTGNPNHAERLKALTSAKAGWSVAVTLVGTGLIAPSGNGWAWNKAAFAAGEVNLGLQKATESNCGACHGAVDNGSAPTFVTLGTGNDYTTEKTGQIFSPQRIKLSGLGLKDKDSLRRPWDVHAERLVQCTECHYAPERPGRLEGTIPEALQAKAGERRRCESCHSLEGRHPWLPEPARHLATVACESCHVSKLHMAAQSQMDSTVVRVSGQPQYAYRGIAEGSVYDSLPPYIEGYQPLLLSGQGADGIIRVGPYNLVSRWYWADADGKEVASPIVYGAYLSAGVYHADVQKAFDHDGNGVLSEGELRLDSDAKVAIIAGKLAALGIKGPQVKAVIEPYAIHHNVTHLEWAARSCTGCHPESENDRTTFTLAPYLPAGVMPELAAGAGVVLDGSVAKNKDGSLSFVPAQGVASGFAAAKSTLETARIEVKP